MAQFSFSFCPESCRAAEHRLYLPPAASQQETHRKTSRKAPVRMPLRDNVCSERKAKNAAAQIMGSSIVFCLG